MTEKLVITRLGSHGEGIAEAAAGAVYVPYALPGETVEVEPWPGHADRRRLNRVAAASTARTTPICPHFGACGGCDRIAIGNAVSSSPPWREPGSTHRLAT
jgi:23S rRNA (uracil1939-C5)-methyltransferase